MKKPFSTGKQTSGQLWLESLAWRESTEVLARCGAARTSPTQPSPPFGEFYGDMLSHPALVARYRPLRPPAAPHSNPGQPPQTSDLSWQERDGTTALAKLLAAPVDGRSSAEMDRAIRTIVESGTLGQAKVESLHCGGTMCRLNLEGDSDGTVDGATRAFAERTPKLFAGISVFPTKTGKRAIYLAKVGEDLRPDAQE